VIQRRNRDKPELAILSPSMPTEVLVLADGPHPGSTSAPLDEVRIWLPLEGLLQDTEDSRLLALLARTRPAANPAEESGLLAHIKGARSFA
jgi:hypothetical protein